MTPVAQTIGQRIREARLSQGWGQRELAGLIGVTTRAIKYWENGGRKPAYGSLLLIAGALGCSHEWLMTGTNPSPEREHSDDQTCEVGA